MLKSATDLHWNERAIVEQDTTAVNIADVTQRELETEFLRKHIKSTDKVLEVGCGNGFLTNTLREIADHVDAFDYAENMVEQAKSLYGEKNNRFFHDNLLAPTHWDNEYDLIVCVRVLINLRNIEEQFTAVQNMAKALKKGGKLILIEGYIDGFIALNELRSAIGLEALTPAPINYYSKLDDMKKKLMEYFVVKDTFHTGSFDFLTRVVYPCLVGAENATGHSDFHTKIRNLAFNYNPDAFSNLARLQGLLLEKI